MIRKLSKKGKVTVFVGALLISVTAIGNVAYGWFTYNLVNKGSTITTGSYKVETTVVDSTARSRVEIDSEDGTCQLIAGKEYNITLTAEGTVATGYCKITEGDKVWYTDAITPEKSLSFTLIPNESATFEFEGIWGESGAEDIIKQNDTIGELPDSEEVTESKKLAEDVLPVQQETAKEKEPAIDVTEPKVEEEKDSEENEKAESNDTEKTDVVTGETAVTEKPAEPQAPEQGKESASADKVGTTEEGILETEGNTVVE